MSTVLGDIPEELTKEQRLNEQKYQRTQRLIELLFEGYQSGELGLVLYLRLVRGAIKFKVQGEAAALLLGRATASALDTEPQKQSRGRKGVPQSIRAAALEVLDEVIKREGLPLTRAPGNAFERVCGVFRDADYPAISPTELERWRAARV